MATEVADYKDQVRRTWSQGDYSKLAVRVMPIAEHVCDCADVGPGRDVLDIATGTGNVAIAAARRGAAVTAIDLTPHMVELTSQRAAGENVSIRTMPGDAEDLPFPPASFDAALSVCGLWWAPRPDVAIGEARRVLRPGGVVSIAGFTPDSYFGRVEELIKSHRPLPDGIPERNDWANTGVAVGRLERRFRDVSVDWGSVPWVFDSAAEATEFLFTNSSSHLAARTDLDASHARRLTDEVEQLTTRSSKVPDKIHIDLEYVIFTGRGEKPDVT